MHWLDEIQHLYCFLTLLITMLNRLHWLSWGFFSIKDHWVSHGTFGTRCRVSPRPWSSFSQLKQYAALGAGPMARGELTPYLSTGRLFFKIDFAQEHAIFMSACYMNFVICMKNTLQNFTFVKNYIHHNSLIQWTFPSKWKDQFQTSLRCSATLSKIADIAFLLWILQFGNVDFQTCVLLKSKKVENAKSWCLVHRAKWRDTMEITLSVTLTQGNEGMTKFWTNYMYDFLHDKWSVSPIPLSVILRCNLSTFPVEWIQFCSDGINSDKLRNCHH